MLQYGRVGRQGSADHAPVIMARKTLIVTLDGNDTDVDYAIRRVYSLLTLRVAEDIAPVEITVTGAISAALYGRNDVSSVIQEEA